MRLYTLVCWSCPFLHGYRATRPRGSIRRAVPCVHGPLCSERPCRGRFAGSGVLEWCRPPRSAAPPPRATGHYLHTRPWARCPHRRHPSPHPKNTKFVLDAHAGFGNILFAPTHGELAQLGERMTGSHEVRGSNPLFSTTHDEAGAFRSGFFRMHGHLWPYASVRLGTMEHTANLACREAR